MGEVLYQVQNLSVGFKDQNKVLKITDSVSFTIHRGEWYALVGESGCGKSLTALALVGLLPSPYGQIIQGSLTYKNTPIQNYSQKEWSQLRGKEIGMIFQEPMSALNPLYRMNRQLLECFDYHSASFNKEKRIQEVLQLVGLTDSLRVLQAYPHQLSGGMQQRMMIAMAILLEPQFLIADEPTTALDVTIQAQIMEVLGRLQKEMGLSLLFITHNLALMVQYSHRIGVMYAGRMVEESTAEAFIHHPIHPYTQGLIKALPGSRNKSFQTWESIPGRVPSPKDFVEGCRFYDRCALKGPECIQKPQMLQLNPEHTVSCWKAATSTNEGTL